MFLRYKLGCDLGGGVGRIYGAGIFKKGQAKSQPGGGGVLTARDLQAFGQAVGAYRYH
ncbi:MAG: hypothetical protein KKH28_02650 [Elusimicrobia bacterium]|nr:hypothetical protein [Elusimicrobiota bacterium]